MTYEPAGAPLDPARGEAIVASATGGTVFAETADGRTQQVARPVTRRPGGLSKPAQAIAVGGAGVLTGLLLSAVLPGRRGRLISAPPLKRRRRRLKSKQTTSVLVDLHLLDR